MQAEEALLGAGPGDLGYVGGGWAETATLKMSGC